MSYSLRPYQAKAIQETRAQFYGRRSGILAAPTGAGKTVIGCHLIESANTKGSRTLCVVHRKELLEQFSAKLRENGVAHGIIKAGYVPAPWERVQIASVQTYTRRMDTLQHKYDFIVIDEAHHAAAKSYQTVLEASPSAKVLGLSATPYRADGKGLAGTFDFLVCVETIAGLTETGYLVPSRLYVGQKVNLSQVDIERGDYVMDDLGVTMSDPKLVGSLVREWQKHAKDRITVVFATTIAHSKLIRDAFLEQGVAAEHLDGTTPTDEREAILARLASGQTRVVSNCGVLTEGWDCPPVSAIILARPTKSRGLWRQMIGRCLRTFPGKTDCKILDAANATEEHGYVTDPDQLTLTEGMQVPESLVRWKCRLCGAILRSKPRFCPGCGTDTQARSEQLELGLEEQDAYEMFEVKAPRKYRPKQTVDPSSDAAITLMARLMNWGRRERKPLGAVYGTFRSRTKTSPTNDTIRDGRARLREWDADTALLVSLLDEQEAKGHSYQWAYSTFAERTGRAAGKEPMRMAEQEIAKREKQEAAL